MDTEIEVLIKYWENLEEGELMPRWKSQGQIDEGHGISACIEKQYLRTTM